MPPAENGFQILNLHPLIYGKTNKIFFNGHLSKFYHLSVSTWENYITLESRWKQNSGKTLRSVLSKSGELSQMRLFFVLGIHNDKHGPTAVCCTLCEVKKKILEKTENKKKLKRFRKFLVSFLFLVRCTGKFQQIANRFHFLSSLFLWSLQETSHNCRMSFVDTYHFLYFVAGPLFSWKSSSSIY